MKFSHVFCVDIGIFYRRVQGVNASLSRQRQFPFSFFGFTFCGVSFLILAVMHRLPHGANVVISSRDRDVHTTKARRRGEAGDSELERQAARARSLPVLRC